MIHRSPEFCEESLDFVREVNEYVTMLILNRGTTRPIPQEQADPKVEAAAVMLAANLFAVADGDWEVLANKIWPRAAAGNLRQFEAHLRIATAEANRG